MSEILRRELHSSIHVLAGDPKPLMLMYHVTNRCNFRCIFCNWWRMAPALYQNETPASKVKDHIKQFADLGTVVTDFTGGEPLMRKELPEFFREAKDCGMLTSMATNGWFVRQRIDEIAPFLDMARVSLDSPVPEEHDRIRGVRRAFVRAVDAIKCFREYSVPVQGGCVLTRETLSLDRLEKFSELGQDLDIQINFIVVTPVPLEFNKDESQARNLMADNLKAAKLLRRARKLPKLGISSFLIKLLEAGGNHVDTSICRAASTTVSVMADGSMIMPCMHYPELKVNLNTGTTAEEVWYSEKAMEVRQMCGRYPYCEGCLIICLLEISQLAMPRNLIRNFASMLHDLSMFKKQLKIGG